MAFKISELEEKIIELGDKKLNIENHSLRMEIVNPGFSALVPESISAGMQTNQTDSRIIDYSVNRNTAVTFDPEAADLISEFHEINDARSNHDQSKEQRASKDDLSISHRSKRRGSYSGLLSQGIYCQANPSLPKSASFCDLDTLTNTVGYGTPSSAGINSLRDFRSSPPIKRVSACLSLEINGLNAYTNQGEVNTPEWGGVTQKKSKKLRKSSHFNKTVNLRPYIGVHDQYQACSELTKSKSFKEDPLNFSEIKKKSKSFREQKSNFQGSITIVKTLESYSPHDRLKAFVFQKTYKKKIIDDKRLVGFMLLIAALLLIFEILRELVL